MEFDFNSAGKMSLVRLNYEQDMQYQPEPHFEVKWSVTLDHGGEEKSFSGAFEPQDNDITPDVCTAFQMATAILKSIFPELSDDNFHFELNGQFVALVVGDTKHETMYDKAGQSLLPFYRDNCPRPLDRNFVQCLKAIERYAEKKAAPLALSA